MRHTRFVRGVESPGDLERHGQGIAQAERFTLQTLSQGHAFQVLEHQETLAFVASGLVDLADVRMLEQRYAGSFAFKAFAERSGKDLDLDFARVPRIAGLVEFPTLVGFK